MNEKKKENVKIKERKKKQWEKINKKRKNIKEREKKRWKKRKKKR